MCSFGDLKERGCCPASQQACAPTGILESCTVLKLTLEGLGNARGWWHCRGITNADALA